MTNIKGNAVKYRVKVDGRMGYKSGNARERVRSMSGLDLALDVNGSERAGTSILEQGPSFTGEECDVLGTVFQ